MIRRNLSKFIIRQVILPIAERNKRNQFRQVKKYMYTGNEMDESLLQFELFIVRNSNRSNFTARLTARVTNEIPIVYLTESNLGRQE